MKLAKEDRTERENRIPETTTDPFSSFGAPKSKDDAGMFLVFVFVFDSWMLEAKCRILVANDSGYCDGNCKILLANVIVTSFCSTALSHL